jgi:hypothetical protein
MSPKTANDDDHCITYARECVRLAGLIEDRDLRERLLNMGREWMAVAMGEKTMPEPSLSRFPLRRTIGAAERKRALTPHLEPLKTQE